MTFQKEKKIAPPWLCATKLHNHGHPCRDVMRTAMEIIHRSYEICGGMDKIIGTYKSAKNLLAELHKADIVACLGQRQHINLEEFVCRAACTFGKLC